MTHLRPSALFVIHSSQTCYILNFLDLSNQIVHCFPVELWFILCLLLSGYMYMYVSSMEGPSCHDLMVVGSIISYAISAYLHLHCEFESRPGEMYSIHHVINFVSNLRQVGDFLRVFSTNKTECNDITKILLKVTLNTITLTL